MPSGIYVRRKGCGGNYTKKAKDYSINGYMHRKYKKTKFSYKKFLKLKDKDIHAMQWVSKMQKVKFDLGQPIDYPEMFKASEIVEYRLRAIKREQDLNNVV